MKQYEWKYFKRILFTQTEVFVPSSAHWKPTNPFIIKTKQVVQIDPT